MANPRAIISVTNDLTTDQRVDKVARTLCTLGYSVTLTGRRKSDSHSLAPRSYETNRFILLFEKGPFFYAEYNIRLFFYLLRNKASVFVANDLDTLPASFLASKVTRTHLVYDSHEYFTEVPELSGRPVVKKTWKMIEQLIFPRLHYIFTVNDSIAGIYRSVYQKEIHVLRNVPESGRLPALLSRAELGLPETKAILLLQGAGINIDRGAEEAVLSMEYLEDVLLLIIGGGDIIDQLKKTVNQMGWQDKVWFLPKQSYERLMQYTQCADIGLTLDKDTNLNYRFSLPNKLFDYIIAGVPVLASPLPEVRKIMDHYEIGMTISNHKPDHIAFMIKTMLSDKKQLEKWKENLKLAASELCWEKEAVSLADVYKQFL